VKSRPEYEEIFGRVVLFVEILMVNFVVRWHRLTIPLFPELRSDDSVNVFSPQRSCCIAQIAVAVRRYAATPSRMARPSCTHHVLLYTSDR
jgi:hypothetical protein